MKGLISELRGAIAATFILTIVCCGIYPLAVYGVAQLAFPNKANGSLIVDKNGVVRGSRLIGQSFSGPQYFHPRPSAAGNGYDAMSSGGSNLGPTSQKLNDQIKARIGAYRKENGLTENDPIPADAVTGSGSGLDPHISVKNAQTQLRRIARARSLNEQVVRGLLQQNTDRAFFGILGEDGVNVLALNLALDGSQSKP